MRLKDILLEAYDADKQSRLISIMNIYQAQLPPDWFKELYNQTRQRVGPAAVNDTDQLEEFVSDFYAAVEGKLSYEAIQPTDRLRQGYVNSKQNIIALQQKIRPLIMAL
jgi:hypothetical protein